jgi:hypothetical protein
MPPVRIKLYGLFPMRKRTYLFLQGLTLSLIVAGIAVGLWWPRPMLAPRPDFWRVFLVTTLDVLPWAGLVIFLAEVVETVLVLNRFAVKQAEADQAAEVASPQPITK